MPTTPTLPAACRALLDATASLPGAASLPVVRAIVDARALVAAALREAEEMASRGEVARLTRRADCGPADALAPVEPLSAGHFWPLVAGEWAGPDGLRVRLYRRRVGPVDCIPQPGSIATRTKCSPPVPALMGWWSVHKGDRYLGYVQIHRGQNMTKPPKAAVEKVVERAGDHRVD